MGRPRTKSQANLVPLRVEDAVSSEVKGEARPYKKKYTDWKLTKQKTWYTFRCETLGCDNTFTTSETTLSTRPTHLCYACNNKKRNHRNPYSLRPYEAHYKQLLRSGVSRGFTVELTYEEYLAVASSNLRCVYCEDVIPWVPSYSISNKISAYFIDRIDNDKGYTAENVVVACSVCNITRGSRFKYKEMLILGKAIAEIKAIRRTEEGVEVSPGWSSLKKPRRAQKGRPGYVSPYSANTEYPSLFETQYNA